MYDQHQYGPYGDLPPAQNPLSRRAKIALGTIGAAALIGGVIIFMPRKASAAPTPKPTPTPKPAPKPDKQPPGEPPNPTGQSCRSPGFGYDASFWDAGGTVAARQRIFDAFEAGGYQTPTGRDTMNDLGGDNQLGGGDDIANPEVKRYQNEWNAVSRWGGWQPTSVMGGLDPDGLVGPCTINGLKFMLDNVTQGQTWQDIVAAARAAGYNP